jgi:hypothetical protein
VLPTPDVAAEKINPAIFQTLESKVALENRVLHFAYGSDAPISRYERQLETQALRQGK